MAGLMVLGTASNAGKSAMVAALLRIYANRGYRVAPFKAQNMALNSGITDDGSEIGRAQIVQAEAARIPADVRMNPILLKPTAPGVSQVIVNGRVYKNLETRAYYAEKKKLFPKALAAYESLADEFDFVLCEGAGSASEINLKSVDMVNMGFAKAADIPAILIADIDRGGMFASVVGTWELFDDDERGRLKGIVVNRFRGDVSILEPGLKILEERTGVPVLGVVPYADVRLEAEDSLAMEFHETDRGAVDIAVIRLPHISNVTDVAPFQMMADVSVRAITRVEEFGEPDLLIIPGTKNTMADLKWLKETGIYARILRHAERGGIIFSICGGFQMMGDTLSDPEGVESGGTMEGLKLFPMDTVFSKEKKQCRVETTITASEGLLKNLSGKKVAGYEIHMGQSEIKETGEIEKLTESGGIVKDGRFYGTYIHGFFDAPHIAEEVVAALKKEKNLPPKEAMDYAAFKDSQIEKLAAVVEEALDMKRLDEVLGLL